MSKIASAEHRQRVAALQAKVTEHGYDVFLVSSRENIFYLTGVVCHPLERPLFVLIWRDGSPCFLLPALEAEHIRETADNDHVESYWEYPAPPGQGWADRLREMLGGATNIGIEPSLRAEISDGLGEVSLRPMPLIEQLRVVKSPAEVEMIRRAASCAELGIKRLLAASYYGSWVVEGFVETRTVMKRIIRESDNFNPLLTKVLMGTWAGPRSARPHSIPKLDDRLLEGPHVGLALTTFDGYAAECERTYFTARPAAEVCQAFDAMLEARRIAFGMVRPSVPCGDIDAAVKEFLAKEGYADKRLHRTGHGIGIAYHAETPWLAEGSDEVLAAGMVASIEPGIYLPGIGGLRHSDTVLVTEDGYESLTQHSIELEKLTITSWKPFARLKGMLVRRSLGC
ncbi:MAG: Xaa-Pro peptidase family protein [Planctomycetota bacterium]